VLDRGHVDDKAAGQSDVGGYAGALLSQGFLGNLHQNLLAFPEQLADGGVGRSVHRSGTLGLGLHLGANLGGRRGRLRPALCNRFREAAAPRPAPLPARDPVRVAVALLAQRRRQADGHPGGFNLFGLRRLKGGLFGLRWGGLSRGVGLGFGNWFHRLYLGGGFLRPRGLRVAHRRMHLGLGGLGAGRARSAVLG